MIKLCGMRREEDIAYANEFLPDFVGFILAEGFWRTVDIGFAARISRSLDSRIKKVGSSNAAWWLRSPYSGNAKTFCQITETGAASNLNAAAYGGIGVSPAWCF